MNHTDETITNEDFLLYHPVSFELSLLSKEHKITSVSVSSNLSEEICRSWLLAVHERSRFGIFEDEGPIDGMVYANESFAERRVTGSCMMADGKVISFDTASHFIDIFGPNGALVNRRVIPEPFPKRYKMLYDRMRRGKR